MVRLGVPGAERTETRLPIAGWDLVAKRAWDQVERYCSTAIIGESVSQWKVETRGLRCLGLTINTVSAVEILCCRWRSPERRPRTPQRSKP